MGSGIKGGYVGPTTPKLPPTCLWPSGGCIGSYVRTFALMNNCHPRPVNAYPHSINFYILN